jgi:hypothetical protein
MFKTRRHLTVLQTSSVPRPSSSSLTPESADCDPGDVEELTISFDESFTPGIMDGDIFKPGPLGRARQLSSARARLLDLSGRAVARHSLENRHVPYLIGPF